MGLLRSLERRLSRFAIVNITLYLVFGQGLCLVLLLAKPQVLARIVFIPAAVAHGEAWRIATFMFLPPCQNPILAAFALYLLYLMGTALEAHWGTFRYNLYLLIGAVATMASACAFPEMPATNAFVMGSVFLAFAHLYPDFQILLFFLLPIRIKWLALLMWLGYAWVLLFGSWPGRLLVLASVANFLLFFGQGLWLTMRSANRRMLLQARSLAQPDKPFHTCAACGITDRTHPHAEFRYCPQCAGTPGYCIEHIANHTHIAASKAAAPR